MSDAYTAGYASAEEMIDIRPEDFKAALQSIHWVRENSPGTPEFWHGVLDAILDRNEEQP